MKVDTTAAVRLLDQDPRYFERLVLGSYLYDRRMALRLEAAGALDIEWQTPEHKALFHSLRMYHQTTGYACHPNISVPLLESALGHQASTTFAISESAIPTAMQTLMRAAGEYCASPQAAQDFLEACTPHWLIGQMYRSAEKTRTLTSAADQYAEISSKATQLRLRWTGKDDPLAAGKLVHPLEVARQEREPTWITLPWAQVNEQMDGGLRKTDKVMLLGATGAGKSVVACHVAGHFALNQKKLGVYIFTEDEHVDYLDRVVASQTMIEVNLLRQGIFSPTSRASQDQKQRASGVYHWLDPKTNGYANGLFLLKYPSGEDMEAVLQQATEHVVRMAGRRPEFMVVDWLHENLVSNRSDRKNEENRDRLNRAADTLADFADRERILAFATAQVNVTGRERIKAVSEEHLQNSKQMTRHYTVVMGLSCLAEMSVSNEESMEVTTTFMDDQFLNISKLRYGRTGLVPVRRNYKYQRLESRKW